MAYGSPTDDAPSEQLRINIQHVDTQMHGTISFGWQAVTDRATARQIVQDLLDALTANPPAGWAATGGSATYSSGVEITPT
jgi:hypothetical protein